MGLRLNAPGMEFASEMVIKSQLAELDMREVATTLSPDGRSRPPHLRSWRDGWLHLKLLLTFAPRWLFYIPGAAMVTTGLMIFIALLGGPATIAGVTFDSATLILSSALILIGFQMMCFYALARQYSVRFGLLPSSPRFERLSPMISVDRASQIGGLLVLAGIAVAVSAVVIWARAGWGDLDPSAIVRPAAFAVVSASLGVQVVTTGFLSALLRQGGADDAAPERSAELGLDQLGSARVEQI